MTEKFSLEHAASYYKEDVLAQEVNIFEVFTEEIGEDLVDFMSNVQQIDSSHTSTTIESSDNVDSHICVEVMSIALQICQILGKNISLETFQNATEIPGGKEACLIIELAITRFAIQKVVSEDLLEQHPELMTYISESVMGEV